jgi:hypothetical protein
VQRGQRGLEVVGGERHLPGEPLVVVGLEDDEALHLALGDGPGAEAGDEASEHTPIAVVVDRGHLHRPVIEREQGAVAGDWIVPSWCRHRAAAFEPHVAGGDRGHESIPIVGVDRIGQPLDDAPGGCRAHLLTSGVQRGEGGVEVVAAEAGLVHDQAVLVDLDQLQGCDLGLLDGTVAEPDHVAAQDAPVTVDGQHRSLVGDVVEPEQHPVLVEVGVLVRQPRAAISLPVTGGEQGDVGVPVPLVGGRRHVDRRPPGHRVVLLGGRGEALQLEVRDPPITGVEEEPVGDPPGRVDGDDRQGRPVGIGRSQVPAEERRPLAVGDEEPRRAEAEPVVVEPPEDRRRGVHHRGGAGRHRHSPVADAGALEPARRELLDGAGVEHLLHARRAAHHGMGGGVTGRPRYPHLRLATDPGREGGRALRRARLEGTAGLLIGASVVAERAEHRGEGEAGVGDQQQGVGPCGEVDGLSAEPEGEVAVAPARGALGTHPSPCDPGLEVGACERLGLGRHMIRILDPILHQEGSRQERCCLGRFTVETALAQAQVRRPEDVLSARRVAVEQLDQAGGDLGLEAAVGEAEAFDRPPR